MGRREPLTSRTSPQVTAVRELHTARGRTEAGAFLVEGPQAVREAFDRAPRVDTVFVTADGAHRWADLVALAHAREIPVLPVIDTVLDAMAETNAPQGILAVCEIPSRELGEVLGPDDSIGPVVLLESISDPGNAGTIIRTADAAGASGVMLTSGSVDPYNGKCVRSTAGSIFHLPVVSDVALVDAVRTVQSAGLRLVVATGDADADLLEWAPQAQGRLCWAFGSEAHGVSDLLRASADVLIRIPMLGAAESLNVASAAAVCLFADMARSHGRITGVPQGREGVEGS